MKDNPADVMPQLVKLSKQKAMESSKRIRGTVEICGDILDICSDGGAIKTHVMYKANLSYGMMAEYSKSLLECELLQLSKKDSKVVFKTTEKGRQFLLHYRCIQMLTKNSKKKLVNLGN